MRADVPSELVRERQKCLNDKERERKGEREEARDDRRGKDSVRWSVPEIHVRPVHPT